MNNKAAFALAIILATSSHAVAATCTPTGFVRDSLNMTAALIDPPGTVTGTVDATGCNIAIYYDSAGASGTVKNADVYGANYFGVLVNGDAGTVNVDILDSSIHDIGEVPHNGTQHGVAVYYRGFFEVSAVTGKISGNRISAYQKGGIVTNGAGVQAVITGNTVTGDGHVDFIAQNGIQVGYGPTVSVMKNTVSGNSYIGFPGDGSASGGILVVGGAGYGACPDGNDCPYTTNTKINDNILANNDVGVYLSNLDGGYNAPNTATNIKVVNNAISDDQCYNKSYQAAISDVGDNDKMITNRISGPGYGAVCVTLYNPTGELIDASTTFTNEPKVHATK